MKNGSPYLRFLSFGVAFDGVVEAKNADGWYCLVGLNIIYSINIDFSWIETHEEKSFCRWFFLTEKNCGKEIQ